MMQFHITGHENILSTHKNTFEFTKDKHLTKSGTCIVGVNADFELEKIKKEFGHIGEEDSKKKNYKQKTNNGEDSSAIKNIGNNLLKNNIKIIIECENEKDEITALYNPKFNHDKEMVIRLGSYIDDRTFATDATKSAMYLNKKLIKLLQEGRKTKVTITCI